MKNLPISLQSFAGVRDMVEDFVYIDKTEFIYKIASHKGTYFLSRPRRFGKSLLVSAM
ncbi:MAG: AAA family ATPase, partial [Bacteroidales bacterium]|nr:AAA family ATPase [Bacteroidales bacterium]